VRTSAETRNTVDDRPKNFLTDVEIADFLEAARKGWLLADLARRKKANRRQVGGDGHVIYDSRTVDA